MTHLKKDALLRKLKIPKALEGDDEIGKCYVKVTFIRHLLQFVTVILNNTWTGKRDLHYHCYSQWINFQDLYFYAVN